MSQRSFDNLARHFSVHSGESRHQMCTDFVIASMGQLSNRECHSHRLMIFNNMVDTSYNEICFIMDSVLSLLILYQHYGICLSSSCSFSSSWSKASSFSFH